MHILGISAFYHDSAACLVRDGEIVAAAQEERFSRKKHDHDFPVRATQYCLEEAGITPESLDLVAFYDKPLSKFDRILETYLAFWPQGFRLFLMGMPKWLKQKLHIPREIARSLDGRYRRRLIFLEHHESHAASAFFPSPFEEAAILTLDGVGEWATCSISMGRRNKIQLLRELRFPHSLGLLYSAFTYFVGFRVNSGEYKLMGLAPYGRPLYKDLILQTMLDLKEDGSFRLNMDYFDYCARPVMTSKRMDDLFSGPPRRPESPITQREMDIAASVQAVAEEVILRVARHAHSLTGLKNLAMAGGVALNCVANRKLLRDGPFDRVWVQPAAGDAGGALGSAMFVWHQLLEQPRAIDGLDKQRGSLLGPRYSNAEVRAYLDSVGAVYHFYADEDELLERIANLIATEKIVAHFAGRMEFGPRALGARSILGDPRSPKMQRVMNQKIKFRESFRPFAPAVLHERACEIFDVNPGEESPYMSFVAPIRHELRTHRPSQDRTRGLEIVNDVRSTLPAVTHVDYSARIQTVDAVRNPRFYRLLKAFETRTSCPVVVNTSFNVRGEPIVNSPAEAYRCFLHTSIDALAIENFLLFRSEQKEPAATGRDAYRSAFSLD